MALTRVVVARDEVVLRAVAITDWDDEHKRLRSSLFISSSNAVSVTRLAILPLPKILSIFHRDLSRWRLAYQFAGEISVARIEDIGAPEGLRVVEAPEPCNKGHAEIPKLKIKRTIAKRLNEELMLRLHPAPPIAPWKILLNYPLRRICEMRYRYQKRGRTQE